MKKESVSMGVIFVGLVLVMILVSVFSNDDSTENTSAAEGWNEYYNKSSSYFSTTSRSSGNSGNSGNRSSYWYDSPEVRKKKADDTLMKYYEYDENGNLTKKEGTIVNGKPYHKE